MDVTLKDIEASEKICEAADVLRDPWLIDGEYISIKVNEPDWEVNYSGLEPILIARDGYPGKETILAFASHASTMLPATLALVREMMSIVRTYAQYHCEDMSMFNRGEPCGSCDPCQARRLVERMEEPSHD